MSYNCPKNPAHLSDDSDYCSICGAKIAGDGGLSSLSSGDAFASAFNPKIGSSSNNDPVCPDCGTARLYGAKFCEVCRFNFEAGASWGSTPSYSSAPPVFEAVAQISAIVSTALEPATLTVIAESPPVPPALRSKWEAIIVSDPSLYTDPEPGVVCPLNEPELIFPLDSAENLIGRRSDKRDIHPEIPLNDPGVSHRHAKLLRQSDLSFALLDVGSTNGTQLNGKEARAGIKVALADGDSVTVGLWTRITIKRV